MNIYGGVLERNAKDNSGGHMRWQYGVMLVFACMLCIVENVHGEEQNAANTAGNCLSAEKLNQLQAAADRNDLYAIRDLDAYYGSCAGDREKVLAYAKKKAEIGTADDVYSYGVVLESYANQKDAFPWFLKAAQMGDSHAKLRVAEAYRDGDVVAKDLKQALIWFQLGATCQEFGTTDMEKLAEFLWTEKPVPLAGPKALAWFNVVERRLVLAPFYKTMRDDIAKSLTKDELEMANHLTDEYAYGAGCVIKTNE